MKIAVLYRLCCLHFFWNSKVVSQILLQFPWHMFSVRHGYKYLRWMQQVHAEEEDVGW